MDKTLKQKVSKTLIVSPSGNFYGSEQVLYNFLSNTNQNYYVFVPESSMFQEKLKKLNNHKIKGYKNIKILYFKILFLFAINKFKTLYINEGGHINYAKIIAKLYFNKKIFVHLRLVEDCNQNRIGVLPKNLKLISISNYISSLLAKYDHIKLYDPIDTKGITSKTKTPTKTHKTVSIIGRVSSSKGIDNYEQFFLYLRKNQPSIPIEFNFFGDVVKTEPKAASFFKRFENHNEPKITFSGFVKNQELIYSSTDAVLHLNPHEPLGRIGLESWAREIPFICFNNGGTGEINQRLNALKFSINIEEGWEQKLLVLLENVLNNKDTSSIREINALLKVHFNVDKYVKELEALF
jgi:hypothetical protein